MAVLGRSVVGRSAWLLLMMLTSAGCRIGPAQWGPFRGQIVDAETGAPIAGAHFMVMWERDNPNPVHWTQSFYDAQETVTDADGRFEIPRQQRLFTLLVGTPRFDAFAPGYVAESSEVTPRAGQVYVDPTILKMRRLETREEQCKHEPFGIGGRFPKSEAPRFSTAIDEYVERLACRR